MKFETRLVALVTGLMALTSHALAAQAAPTWHLQLDHAIRPTEGTEGVLGDVSSMTVTRGGVVYVAERKVPRVTRYDATGKFAGVVMRDGEGPSETRGASLGLYGDTVIVYDQALTRLTRIAPSGKVLNQQHVDAHSFGSPVSITRDGAVILSFGWTRDGFNRSALRLSPSGRIDTLGWNERKGDHQWIDWMYPGGVIKGGAFVAAPAAAFDPLGRVVIGGSSTSRWYVLSGKDTVQRVVVADHPVMIPKQVRDSAWDAFIVKVQPIPGAAGALKKELLPTILPAWVTLDINPRGEWWIGRPGMDGKLASWDIVENGKLVGHVAIPDRVTQAPGVYGRAHGSDLIALLHENENAVPWIGVYRIVRK